MLPSRTTAYAMNTGNFWSTMSSTSSRLISRCDLQLNHVLKTRDTVTRNNEKVQRQQANEDKKRSTGFVDPPRDQGFTRPKVKPPLFYPLPAVFIQGLCFGRIQERTSDA